MLYSKKILIGLLMASFIGTVSANDDPTPYMDLGTLNNQVEALGRIGIPAGTSFADNYRFDLNPGAETFATAIKVTLVLDFLEPDLVVSNIKNFSIELQDSLHNVLAFDNTFSTTGTLDLSANLGAGNDYELVVRGLAEGTAGGIYTGVLTAVPEVDTYAMLLAGLGLIGFKIARRSRG